MEQQLSAIVTAESDYDDTQFCHTETIVLLEAIDTLRGTGKYYKTSELSINDAATILLEAPEVKDNDYDLTDVRKICVKRETHLREGMLAIKTRINELKAEAYDRTKKYLEDRLNEQSNLPVTCKTMRRIQDVLINDPPEINDLEEFVGYINKVNENR